MVCTWRRSQVLGALLAGLLTLSSLAVAQPRIAIDGRYDDDLSRRVVRRNGTLMAPARSMFRQFGSDIERRGDWYSSRYGGHEYRFRPGSRVWYRDDRPLYFRHAPYVSEGSLFLNLFDLITGLGGRFDWDDRYQRGNVYYPRTPVGYGYPYGYGRDRDYYRSSVPLQVQFPKNYARVNERGMTVSGYARPYGDVRVLVYRAGARGNPLVFDSGARVNSVGWWDLFVPLYGDGAYRLVVQSVDEYGRVLGSKTLTVYAD